MRLRDAKLDKIIETIMLELRLLNDIMATKKEVELCFVNKMRKNVIDFTRWDLEYLPLAIKQLPKKDTLVLTRIPKNIGDFTHIQGVKLTMFVDPMADIRKILKAKYGDDRALARPFLQFSRKYKTRTYQININDIEKLNFVKKLDLQGLNLNKLPDFRNFHNLTELNLSDNSITHLKTALLNGENLKRLDISRNRISELDTNISNLKMLEHLNLESNMISDLPLEITKLSNLKWL